MLVLILRAPHIEVASLAAMTANVELRFVAAQLDTLLTLWEFAIKQLALTSVSAMQSSSELSVNESTTKTYNPIGRFVPEPLSPIGNLSV